MERRPIAAPERFVIVLEGKLWNVRRRANVARGELAHMVDRLLTGETVTHEAFEGYGIRLSIEEGTDQGDDGLDDLAVR